MLENPAEAVSYTLLKQEVQANKASNAASLADMEIRFNNEYDLMKVDRRRVSAGILGMIVPIAITAIRGRTP